MEIHKRYEVALNERIEIAKDTLEFRFEKPEGFSFKAGQFADISLINPPEMDDEGNTRTFSIATAPHEPFIAVASRMRGSAFKRFLKKAPPGTKVTLDGPMGAFTLGDDERPAILLAGGIGITPFRSIALDAAKRELGKRVALFYSNRTPEDAPYLDELGALAAKNPRFTFVPTMTKLPAGANWTGERGYITKEMIVKHVEELDKAIYYIAGPQTFILAMKNTLESSGVERKDIKIEEFGGY